MNRFLLSIVSLAAVCGVLANSAEALPPFKGKFQEKYVDSSESDEFKAAFKSAGCYACHVKGAKSKKQLNKYGHELHEALEESGESPKKLLKADKEKLFTLLEAAFKAVESKKAEGGETFGERIKAGKLPAFKEIEKE